MPMPGTSCRETDENTPTVRQQFTTIFTIVYPQPCKRQCSIVCDVAIVEPKLRPPHHEALAKGSFDRCYVFLFHQSARS